jgi:hypothetical protein
MISDFQFFLEEEKIVKYMIEYKIRAGGVTLDQGFANLEALITAFSKWKPEDG